ncbi:hypothetical protein [Falsirhodobacter sp. 20TX0035]|uniref:hypothetical protein n=1 Tax=Falsirhodobacter sp. 20TX0035 TaxID=3022019 RepID=UPI00232B18CB|nr:hypothetical protein [Falsirhodobacter sp. 20TX0035]MDB6454988.1 hypothetical protein [Falsirhodobacter sp. 20TX0035]
MKASKKLGAIQGALRRYRSALFFSMKETWGEDKARRVEADLIRRHEEAEQLHRQTQSRRRGAFAMPDKRVAPNTEVFA